MTFVMFSTDTGTAASGGKGMEMHETEGNAKMSDYVISK